MDGLIYKIVTGDQWRRASEAGIFGGAPVDLADGFIHFSTAGQLRETARRHFSGQSGLVLLEVEAAALGPALRWEPSRGGALFPHLYAALDLAQLRRRWPLPLGTDGRHIVPAEVAGT